MRSSVGFVLPTKLPLHAHQNGRFSPVCPRRSKRLRLQMMNSLRAAREEVVKTLVKDLAQQYEAPLAMDFSIFDDNVTFDDPTTKLRGKSLYKGMLLTIGLLIVPGLFKRDTVFKLKDCELTEDGSKVRTTFATKGTTRWGTSVEITGEDFFWFKDGSNQIVRHQSTWDQSPGQLMKAMCGK